MNWTSTSEPPSTAEKVLAIGLFDQYTTEPYCVRYSGGVWQGWPHAQPPTHYSDIEEPDYED